MPRKKTPSQTSPSNRLSAGLKPRVLYKKRSSNLTQESVESLIEDSNQIFDLADEASRLSSESSIGDIVRQLDNKAVYKMFKDPASDPSSWVVVGYYEIPDLVGRSKRIGQLNNTNWLAGLDPSTSTYRNVRIGDKVTIFTPDSELGFYLTSDNTKSGSNPGLSSGDGDYVVRGDEFVSIADSNSNGDPINLNQWQLVKKNGPQSIHIRDILYIFPSSTNIVRKGSLEIYEGELRLRSSNNNLLVSTSAAWTEFSSPVSVADANAIRFSSPSNLGSFVATIIVDTGSVRRLAFLDNGRFRYVDDGQLV